MVKNPSHATVPLKVPSHQVRLASKWYDSVGLDKFKNREDGTRNTEL